MKTKAIVWSKENCNSCTQAKQLLESNKISCEERVIGHGWSREDLLLEVPLARTVPQIFINDELIGGLYELQKHLQREKHVN
jgi:glutaredoxin